MAQKDIMIIAREVNGAKPKSADEIAAVTKIPKWKVARILKRLKKLGFVESSVEIKFSIGRPRTMYLTTKEGMRFFEDMGVNIFEPPKPEQTVPNTNEV